jgi:hypothetical protein
MNAGSRRIDSWSRVSASGVIARGFVGLAEIGPKALFMLGKLGIQVALASTLPQKAEHRMPCHEAFNPRRDRRPCELGIPSDTGHCPALHKLLNQSELGSG